MNTITAANLLIRLKQRPKVTPFEVDRDQHWSDKNYRAEFDRDLLLDAIELWRETYFAEGSDWIQSEDTLSAIYEEMSANP